MPDTSATGLLGRPLSEVLAALASQHELADGGGPAAALTAAAAAALTAKVARGSRPTWIEAGGAVAHAESLRMQAQALIERDEQAYRKASSVLLHDERSARRGVAAPALATPAGPADRERIVGEASIRAADLSLAIADAGCQIAGLAGEVARRCPSSLRPDALTAVALAEAAACAAARLVEVDRHLPADDPRRAASSNAAHKARQARERALAR
ncbi:MAG TPA: cyclodeaminase/cyclohydrolase family protein [Solirubrobacteraceae bacterium]|nr:cyclodeaminase/cyclohydrolase family protein [Solirubrobacteraceae bacterium]